MRVGVFGVYGRMGGEVCRAVTLAKDLDLVAGLDIGDARDEARKADVIVDFTHPDAVMDNVKWCIDHGRHLVVGTTGFDESRLVQVREWLGDDPQVGVLIAANFSIGAVLMMHFSTLAARHYASVEIIELHHPTKVDAPSGTAVSTAERIAKVRAEAGLGPVPDATEHEVPGAARPPDRSRRHPRARGAPGRSAGTSGGALRILRRDADHPTRLDGPGVVHAGGALGGAVDPLAPGSDDRHGAPAGA